MDRYVIREQRTYEEYPQGNRMIAFPANPATGNNMIPETMYLGGPFAAEFPNAQHINTQNNINAQLYNAQSNINAQSNMNAQLNMNGQGNISAQLNMNGQHNINAQHNMNAQLNISGQSNINQQRKMIDQKNAYAQPNIRAQGNLNSLNRVNAQQINVNAFALSNVTGQNNSYAQPNIMNAQPNNMSAQVNLNAQNSMNAQQRNMGQTNMNIQLAQNYGQNSITGQSPASGIDPRYLAAYSDNSPKYIVQGQQIEKNTTPITSFGSNYQNRGFSGIVKNKQTVATHGTVGPPMKKPNELDLLRNDIQNQIVTRADKLKALHRSGPRVFSGPVEKVMKWHKSLQDIGVLIIYEVVAKCVSVQSGKSCTKNLVVRDDNGPAMQVVYYEVDFLLPELKPPCTVRVIGRMMPGTCRLQAFNVRPATGDDVATLPRRAAVAAHHVAKLCKEYGPNAPNA